MNKILIISLVTFFTLVGTTSFAQNIAENRTVKEWMLDKKDKIKYVSKVEYNQMSSTQKTELNVNTSVLIYDQKVTLEDIKLFENKNSPEDQSYDRVLKWLEVHAHENIKIISQENYMTRPSSERTYIDNLDKKIIYSGSRVTWNDIEIYEQKK